MLINKKRNRTYKEEKRMKEKNIIDKEIGEMLKQKRLEAHLTQGELAKRLE